MKPFDVDMHYFDRHRLPESVEQELNLTHHESVESWSPFVMWSQLIAPYTPKRNTYSTMN